MTPVLERWSVDCPFWVADQGTLRLPVPRRPTSGQLGAAVWALVARSVTGEDLSITATTPAEAIEAYLTCNDEDFAPGGLRVTASDVVIDPGCCVGLDEWRDWLHVLRGEVIDLGHDPDVLLEHRGPLLRLWKDKDQLLPAELPGPGDQHIDIPRDALPVLLSSVHQDLIGFRAALHSWAQAIATDLADPLTVAVDQRLHISAPLDT